ncbi:MAG: hypothetical protein RR962_03265 [Hafnia sp.]
MKAQVPEIGVGRKMMPRAAQPVPGLFKAMFIRGRWGHVLFVMGIGHNKVEVKRKNSVL